MLYLVVENKNMKKIELRGFRGKGKYVIFDDEDFDCIQDKKWHLGTRGYAQSDGTSMHRYIMKCPKGLMIDHINSEKLDNRRENLRICDNSQNLMNQNRKTFTKSSIFKGVHWKKDIKKWQAKITKQKKTYHLGYFTNQENAAKSYDGAAKTLFGEFARLNFN